MNRQLPEDLEQLSIRGPDANRSVVVADAMAQATSDPDRRSRRGGAVAAALILVIGVGAIASVSGESADTEVGSSVVGTDATPTSNSISEFDVGPMNANIPNVQFDGAASDDPGPYFGSAPLLEPQPGFEAAMPDQEFCSAVAVINSRPQPVDTFDRVVVGARYLEAIEKYVPAVLAEPYAVVRSWSEAVANAGSFESPDAPSNGLEFAGAMATVTEFYDARCLGWS